LQYDALFAVGAVAAVAMWLLCSAGHHDDRLTPLTFHSNCGQSGLCFKAKAIEVLQHAVEDYMVHLFEDVSLRCTED
jgi:hypothetical protein